MHQNDDERNEQIEDIIDKFQDLWKNNPDLRFFQLVEIMGNNQNMFYTTDEDALQLIKKTELWMSLHK